MRLTPTLTAASALFLLAIRQLELRRELLRQHGHRTRRRRLDVRRWFDWHRWFDFRWLERRRDLRPHSGLALRPGERLPERQVHRGVLHSERAAAEHHLRDGAGLRERSLQVWNVRDPCRCFGHGRYDRLCTWVARVFVPADEMPMPGMPAMPGMCKPGLTCTAACAAMPKPGAALRDRSDGCRRLRRHANRLHARRGRAGHHRVRVPVREQQSADGHPLQREHRPHGNRPFGRYPFASIQLFYNDEHAMTLGVHQTVINGVSTDYPVSPLTKSPDMVNMPKTGTNLIIGQQAGVDPVGRPMWPALFITDITNDANDVSGDWQWGGAPVNPTYVAGTWKGAVRTVDATRCVDHPGRRSRQEQPELRQRPHRPRRRDHEGGGVWDRGALGPPTGSRSQLSLPGDGPRRRPEQGRR